MELAIQKMHFKWLSGKQCQTFAENVLGRQGEKKKGPPPPFYSNKNIFDLYTVYMLHKNANYSPEERRNRAILCIPPFPLHYPLYFYDAAFI